MPSKIVKTDNLDPGDFSCDGTNISIRDQAVLDALDSNSDGIIDDGFLPTGLTVADVLSDPAFCTEVLSCLDSDSDGIIDASFLPPTTSSVIPSFERTFANQSNTNGGGATAVTTPASTTNDLVDGTLSAGIFTVGASEGGFWSMNGSGDLATVSGTAALYLVVNLSLIHI